MLIWANIQEEFVPKVVCVIGFRKEEMKDTLYFCFKSVSNYQNSGKVWNAERDLKLRYKRSLRYAQANT